MISVLVEFYISQLGIDIRGIEGPAEACVSQRLQVALWYIIRPQSKDMGLEPSCSPCVCARLLYTWTLWILYHLELLGARDASSHAPLRFRACNVLPEVHPGSLRLDHHCCPCPVLLCRAENAPSCFAGARHVRVVLGVRPKSLGWQGSDSKERLPWGAFMGANSFEIQLMGDKRFLHA